MSTPLAGEALLSLLLPFWQIVIGGVVLVAVVVATYRLVQRGSSRMGTAMLISGAAVVGLAVLGVIAQSY